MARRDRRRATTGALFASLLVHVALFIVLAREVAPRFRTPAPVEPDFQVQLVAEPPAGQPPPPIATPRSRRIVAQPSVTRIPLRPVLPRTATAAGAQPPSPPRPVPRPSTQAIPRPSKPASNPVVAGRDQSAAPTAASSAPGAAPWTVRGEDEGRNGVRAFLRATVGCSHQDYANLTPIERTACDRRLAQAARTGAERLDGLSTEARSTFDAAVRAQEEARSGRMQEPFVPCTGAGSNLDRGCINMKSKHPDDGP